MADRTIAAQHRKCSYVSKGVCECARACVLKSEKERENIVDLQ